MSRKQDWNRYWGTPHNVTELVCSPLISQVPVIALDAECAIVGIR